MFAFRKDTALLSAVLLAAAACSPAAAPPTRTPTATPTVTLAPAPTLAATPAATPIAIKDGEPWIAYEWAYDANGDGVNEVGLYMVRPDGRDQHLVLADPAGHPDWSPDGRRLAVDSQPADGDQIWILNADGTDVQVVTCDGEPCAAAAPAWSPDGGQLAIMRALPRETDDQYARVGIQVVDLVTGATRVVAAPPVAGTEYVEYVGPRWSPEGTQIVFTVMRYPVPPTDENILGSSIAIVDADGSDADAPRILTDPAMFGTYPDWSPGGERIVFSTYPVGSFQETTKASNLYTVLPDGTDLTQVTQFGESDTRATEPTWTPDGRQFIFLYIGHNPENAFGERFIALIDADGSDVTRIPVPGAADFWYGTHPRMRPSP